MDHPPLLSTGYPSNQKLVIAIARAVFDSEGVGERARRGRRRTNRGEEGRASELGGGAGRAREPGGRAKRAKRASEATQCSEPLAITEGVSRMDPNTTLNRPPDRISP